MGECVILMISQNVEVGEQYIAAHYEETSGRERLRNGEFVGL